jgi:hypothetical protein
MTLTIHETGTQVSLEHHPKISALNYLPTRELSLIPIVFDWRSHLSFTLETTLPRSSRLSGNLGRHRCQKTLGREEYRRNIPLHAKRGSTVNARSRTWLACNVDPVFMYVCVYVLLLHADRATGSAWIRGVRDDSGVEDEFDSIANPLHRCIDTKISHIPLKSCVCIPASPCRPEMQRYIR